MDNVFYLSLTGFVLGFGFGFMRGVKTRFKIIFNFDFSTHRTRQLYEGLRRYDNASMSCDDNDDNDNNDGCDNCGYGYYSCR